MNKILDLLSTYFDSDMNVTFIVGIIALILIYILHLRSTKFISNNQKTSEDILYKIQKSTKALSRILSDSGKASNSDAGLKTDAVEIVKEDLQQFDSNIERLITNYHEQALFQSKVQFWFSIIASVIGLLFIIVIITVCVSQQSAWYEYFARTFPGIIIEVISALFFSQSKETRERASDFLNRLREDRSYEKGIDIAESISDEKLKSALKSEIALRLCGIKGAETFQQEQNKKDISDMLQ